MNRLIAQLHLALVFMTRLPLPELGDLPAGPHPGPFCAPWARLHPTQADFKLEARMCTLRLPLAVADI